MRQIKSGAVIKLVSLYYWWFKLIRFSNSSRKRDITVFGADTIWMKHHPIAKNDTFYFGKGLASGRLVAFSPSNAGSPYLLTDEYISSQLSKFDFISVRDQPTQKFVCSLISRNVEITCDPAFFIDSGFWEKKYQSTSLPIVSVYATSCKSIKACEQEIVEHGVRVAGGETVRIEYQGYFPSIFSSFGDQKSSPSRVLSRISASRLLITDTFHGLVMALMTKTPFILIGSDIVLSRLDSPLLDFFDSGRITKQSKLLEVLTDPWVWEFADLKESALQKYIFSSREKLILTMDSVINKL
jgi:hypothetical protein